MRTNPRPWLHRLASTMAIVLLASCTADHGSARSGSTSDREILLDGVPMERCSSANYIGVCGSLRVPEDRSDPEGRSISLNVVVIPATDPVPRDDAVFFLSGGPGGAATQDWGSAPALFPQVHARRDIVLVDQRGTGRSNPLVFEDIPDLRHMSEGEARGSLPGWVETALASLDGDPRLYTSSVAADDLDDVRDALGYEQIDLYGGSYGATLAQYYLRQHEERVRTVVLDGGTLLDVPLWELRARRSQEALDSVFARCAADPACHEAFPDLKRDLPAAIERLSDHPIETDVKDRSGTSIAVDGPAFVEQVHHLIAAHRSGEVPGLVHRAAQGDVRQVAELMAEGEDVDRIQAQAMFWSIWCSEAWARSRPERIAELAAGTYLEASVVREARITTFACGLLEPGVVPPGDGEPVRSEVPVLLLNGSEDPQDPPANVADAPSELPNSLTVVAPGQGHTVGTIGCLPEIVGAFIDAATVEGLDVSCADDLVAPPFALP